MFAGEPTDGEEGLLPHPRPAPRPSGSFSAPAGVALPDLQAENGRRTGGGAGPVEGGARGARAGEQERLAPSTGGQVTVGGCARLTRDGLICRKQIHMGYRRLLRSAYIINN